MMINLPKYKIKNEICTVSINNLKIGGDKSVSFMTENGNETKTHLALEIPFEPEISYPQVIKDYIGEKANSFDSLFEYAQNTEADLICIHFEFEENQLKIKIKSAIEKLKNIIKTARKPLILKGTNNKKVDCILLKELAKNIETRSIIAFAQEDTYEDIVPEIIKNNHILVLRSPIDINLAKELNILSIDAGLKPENILIDPDMGALGYGLDYGYSIIEKLKQAAFSGDNMITMPIITFVGEETFKVKEAKTNKFEPNWGEFEKRAAMWEISTAAAIVSAGSNIVVIEHPLTIKTLKETLWN